MDSLMRSERNCSLLIKSHSSHYTRAQWLSPGCWLSSYSPGAIIAAGATPSRHPQPLPPDFIQALGVKGRGFIIADIFCSHLRIFLFSCHPPPHNYFILLFFPLLLFRHTLRNSWRLWPLSIESISGYFSSLSLSLIGVGDTFMSPGSQQLHRQAVREADYEEFEDILLRESQGGWAFSCLTLCCRNRDQTADYGNGDLFAAIAPK